MLMEESELLGSFPILSVDQDTISYSKYGLGYAVDVTTHHPWKNKGCFIARPDNFPDELKKIEEPGALEQYHRDIVSGIDISLNVSANIAAADTKMGMDTEASRSKAYALHAVGTKIHTATVGFVVDTGSELTYFEKKLREYVKYDDGSIDGSILIKRCREFVAQYRCTHYVRALMFGAVDYEVLTHEKYIRIYSAKGELGLHKYGLSPSVGGGARHSFRRQQRHGQRLKIGRYENNKVIEERVIEVEITPVETLVKTPKLSEALTSALKEYRKEKLQELPIGPFLIKCRSSDKPLYLCKSYPGQRVTITESKEEATMFSLSLQKVKQPTLFSICVFSRGGPQNVLAYKCLHNHPPELTQTFDESHVQLSLKDQFRKGVHVDPQEWIISGKWYAIRCPKKHRFTKGVKLCVKKTPGGAFELGVEPTTKNHDEERGPFMQFSLESVPANSVEYGYNRRSVANF